MACRPAWAVVGRAEMVLTSQPGPGMCPMAAWPISEVQGPCHADCFYLQHFIFVGNLRKTFMALLSLLVCFLQGSDSVPTPCTALRRWVKWGC